VCSSTSRHIKVSSIEGTLATSTASLLTYAAFGLEEWSFVAPTDCGLGLFARGEIQTDQLIGEYAGPRLPLSLLKHSTYAFEIPDTRVQPAFDPLPRYIGPGHQITVVLRPQASLWTVTAAIRPVR
jgi:hypothetical protein